MKIVIDIPKEFEEHFKSDRFEDSLARIASDIESFGFQLAGRYEKETITILREAIKNGTPLPEHHGRLIDKDKMIADLLTVDPRYKKEIDWCVRITDAQLTIIEGSESE
jgi:hypothetical protein